MPNWSSNRMFMWGDEEYVQATRIRLSTRKIENIEVWEDKGEAEAAWFKTTNPPASEGFEQKEALLDVMTLNGVIPMPDELHIEESSEGDLGFEALGHQWKRSAEVISRITNKALITNQEDVIKWLKENKPEALVLGERYESNIKKYGFRSWYGWSTASWGTKWDASGGAWRILGGWRQADVRFLTAWSPPDPVYEKITEEGRVNIVASASDEGGGFNSLYFVSNGVIQETDEFEQDPAGKVVAATKRKMEEDGFEKKGGTFSKWSKAAAALMMGKTATLRRAAAAEGLKASTLLEGGITVADVLVDLARRAIMADRDAGASQEKKVVARKAMALFEESARVLALSDPKAGEAATASGVPLLCTLASAGWRDIKLMATSCSQEVAEKAFWMALAENCPQTAESLKDGAKINLTEEQALLATRLAMFNGNPEATAWSARFLGEADANRLQAVIEKKAKIAGEKGEKKEQRWMEASASAGRRGLEFSAKTTTRKKGPGKI